ncbi:MAG TPA: formate dehydrogenase subunit gamma [Albidovulum sp.]|uniref:formate dehydrogenase subunit gamma n=1 Tax=Albidovulum sp. TaxID=1872424 RepID=UPI002C31FA6C|nr:formate dehydrogenase subunit gamma [Albidovulum sp.]
MTAAPGTDDAIARRTDEIISGLIGLEGPLLPIFHALQAEYGHVPAAALPPIADRLNISRAEVHGVMSFYHDFRSHPAAAHVVKLCRAEACQSLGADQIAERAQEKLGTGFHGTSADGKVTLEEVFCLGLCACGPAAMVDGKVVGRVDEARLDQILKEVRA